MLCTSLGNSHIKWPLSYILSMNDNPFFASLRDSFLKKNDYHMEVTKSTFLWGNMGTD